MCTVTPGMKALHPLRMSVQASTMVTAPSAAGADAHHALEVEQALRQARLLLMLHQPLCS